MTFIRRLRSEMPEQAIYLARYGKTAFNKKYGNYLQREKFLKNIKENMPGESV